MRKYNWKKIFISGVWILAGIGTIVLFGAAMQKKNQLPCTDIRIEISGAEKHMFIDEKDILDILQTGGSLKGNKIESLHLRKMETILERNPWVRNAEMFIDNRQVLQVKIEEREPVARIFTDEGGSFYVDSAGLRLPLSDKVSARVPMFTGFPSDKPVLAKPDSALLKDIVSMGKYILADSFWMAQVAQIDILPGASFEMIPVIGDHIVTLGTAADLENKFSRLYTFYKKAWLQNGINTYEKLDVQYNNEVVAVRRGTVNAKIDSARVHQLIENLLKPKIILPADSSRADATGKITDSASGNLPVNTPLKTIPEKISTNSKSAAGINNKANKKTLSNGKSSVKAKTVKKKTDSTKKQPKAVMEKNR